MEPIDLQMLTKFLGLASGEAAGKLTGRPLASVSIRMLPAHKFPADYWPCWNGPMGTASTSTRRPLPLPAPTDGHKDQAPHGNQPPRFPCQRPNLSAPVSPGGGHVSTISPSLAHPFPSRFRRSPPRLPIPTWGRETRNGAPRRLHLASSSVSALTHDRLGISTPSRLHCLSPAALFRYL